MAFSSTYRTVVAAAAVSVISAGRPPLNDIFLSPSDNVTSVELSAPMRDSLHVMAYGGEARAERIESQLAASFQSVPKTSAGGVDQRSLRYLLTQYFAQEHGWQLTGLEPHGFLEDVSEVHDVAIIKEQAPAVARHIYEAANSPRGVSLRDVAALAATVERLVLDQSVDLLQAAYKANHFEVDALLTEAQLHEVLSTHLVLFELSPQVLEAWPQTGASFAELARQNGIGMDHIADFERDAVQNAAFAARLAENPFRQRLFSFEDAAGFVDSLVSNYGKWQNEECSVMSDHLQEHSKNGLVPLKTFFSNELKEMGFEFPESLEYFEEAGILDKSAKSVRLANYLSGPSNCIPASPYLSICCLNECNAVMDQIMRQVQGPESAPEQLLSVLRNVSSRYVDAPHMLPASVQTKLQDIADRQGGAVQLHSRGFALWLNEVFPNECPYPHIVEDKKHLATSYWKDALAESVVVPTAREEQVKSLIEADATTSVASAVRSEEREVLYLAAPTGAGVATLRAALRWLPAVALLGVAGRMAATAARAARTQSEKGSKGAPVQDFAGSMAVHV